MVNQKINISRVSHLLSLSGFNDNLPFQWNTFCGFNSISIWLTASLINNVLTDFNQLVLNHEALLAEDLPSLNQKIKIIVNGFVLRKTNIETLEILCIVIVSIFVFKNIFLYFKNLTMSYVNSG